MTAHLSGAKPVVAMIRCGACGARNELDEDQVARNPIEVRCARCQSSNQVDPEQLDERFEPRARQIPEAPEPLGDGPVAALVPRREWDAELARPLLEMIDDELEENPAPTGTVALAYWRKRNGGMRVSIRPSQMDQDQVLAALWTAIWWFSSETFRETT